MLNVLVTSDEYVSEEFDIFLGGIGKRFLICSEKQMFCGQKFFFFKKSFSIFKNVSPKKK